MRMRFDQLPVGALYKIVSRIDPTQLLPTLRIKTCERTAKRYDAKGARPQIIDPAQQVEQQER